jgi:hypothetical protein
VTEWNEMGNRESNSARIIFVEEPGAWTLPGLHGSDTAYEYRTRKTASLSDAKLELLDRYRIHDICRASVKIGVRDLGLNTATSERLFGRIIGAAT